MKSEDQIQKTSQKDMDKLYRSVRKVIEQARGFVSVAANTAIVRQNWEIGRLIVEDEQGGKTIEKIKEIAKKFNTNIVAGSVIEKSENKLYNTSFVINRT
ncbi:MAG: hypothetical protein IKN52_10845, partial [Victivallales bacterium]|nr:hypothetical protein [Victivallales bacterium]